METPVHKWKHITSLGENTASINLFSDIGGAINAQDFVAEFSFLDSINLDHIEIHINSSGGSVFEGMGIFTAIRSAKTEVHTIVDGVAASMAAVIHQAGDVRKMVDFARLMIHDPSFSNGHTPSDPKDIKLLEDIKESILTMMLSHGNDKDTISKMMTEETWFSANEAVEMKLVDEIITTDRAHKEKETKNMTIEDVFNMGKEITIKQKPIENKMEDLKNHFELTAESTEADILNKVEALETKVTDTEKELSEEKVNHEGTVTALDDAESSIVILTSKVATHVVNTAIKEGKFDESKKEELIKKAVADLEGFTNIVESVKEPKVKITDLIVNADTPDTDPRKDWTIIDYQKKDTKGLQEMISNDTEKYTELYKAQYGVAPQL